MRIQWEDRNLKAVYEQFSKGIDGVAMQATKDMADTLLILSRAEVPHDEGRLQISGHVEPEKDGTLVVYNAVYAAFQHEGKRADGTHVVRFHQKGRKGKYLEDPLKMNINKWKEIARLKLEKFIASGGL